MMLKANIDLRPLLVKFGVVVALSFAGFLYSRLRTRKTKPYLPPPPPPPPPLLHDSCCEIDSGRNDRRKERLSTSKPEEMYMQRTSVDNASVGLSPSNRHGGDMFLLAEFNNLVEEFESAANAGAGPSPKWEIETPSNTKLALRRAEKDYYEQEIKQLRNLVRVLSESERNLEIQLLEYYGLKEQETAVLELQNQLKINNMEAKLFTLKIESLQSENHRLEGQLADHAKVIAELETARSKIKVLKKKLRHEAEQNRQQILNLQKRVARLHEQELQAPANNQDTESKLQRLKALEVEVEELRKSNRRLQIENSELARKLESTQILANSVLEDPETEALNEMTHCLRQENKDLTKQIEQLQADRCADVEELVYLRWINACLRYELRNYQPRPGKTAARDLSKSLSPKSEEKAKKLILEYAQAEGIGDRGMNSMDFDCDQWSSSQTSYGTDFGEVDDSSCENSSAPKPSSSGKIKFFKKLRRLLRGKDRQASSTSKTDHNKYVDSPAWSSGRGMRRTHSDRVITPSQCSSTTSLDIPRWRSPNVDHVKDMEKYQRNSHCGSYGYKRFILGRDDGPGSESPVEPQLDQDSDSLLKSDLLKFAEVLKQPGPGRGKIHKRSASVM